MQKRREEKKATLEAVKKFKKGRGEKPSFLDRATEKDQFPVANNGEFHTKKFGFGGKKHWSKSNTAKSSANMSAFSAAKNSRTTKNLPRTGAGRRGPGEEGG